RFCANPYNPTGSVWARLPQPSPARGDRRSPAGSRPAQAACCHDCHFRPRKEGGGRPTRREAGGRTAQSMPQERQIIELPDFITVRDLADLIDTSPIEVMKELITNGIMASINQQIDYDTAAIVAD